MSIKLWRERPALPVILAWMTAGAILFAVLLLLGYGLVRLVGLLTG